MATIYTTLDSATEIQQLFKKYDRDHYPFGVYEAIESMINDTHDDDEKVKLDVIAWCCDISETSIEEWNRFNDPVETLDELTEQLTDKTSVLYVDEEKQKVYHLAY